MYTKEVMAVIEEAVIQSTMEGTVDGECNKCGYSTTVEPDASYKCHECGEGVMQSPLRKYGLI